MRAVEKARTQDALAMSRAVFEEVFDVLNRPRLARFIRPDLRVRLLAVLSSNVQWFEPSVAVADCRDAKDNKYLELALAAGAATIVSSDTDLCSLDPWRGRRILRPAEYVAAP